MKASIKFREDQPPLLRAKVPVGVLGLPFVSGVVAAAAESNDDKAPRELRLDLTTAFSVGPSLRLSYRPNDTRSPFSVVLKTGVGPFGSPLACSPLSMSAEFGLLGGSRPIFSLLLKPRLGNFALRKSVSAAAAVAPVVDGASTPLSVKVAPVGYDHIIETPIVEFRPIPGIHADSKVSVFPNVSAFTAGNRGGIDGLLSGLQVTARSILPLPNRSALHFKWGLRVPPELRTAFDDPTAGISLRKLPHLVMSKISIERLTDDKIAKAREKKKAVRIEDEDLGGLVRQELEALKADSGQLRRVVEELRAEVGGGWKPAPAALPVTRNERGKPLDKSGKLEDMNEGLMKPLKASSTSAAI